MDQAGVNISLRFEGELSLTWVWLILGFYAVVIAASIAYRQATLKPLSAVRPSAPLFMETWVSGRSLTHLLARNGISLGLLVAVTRRELIVQPHFPFTLAFLPEYFDLDHVVQRSQMRSVNEVIVGLFGTSLAVEVKFETPRGDRTLQLYVHDRMRLIRAIHDMEP